MRATVTLLMLANLGAALWFGWWQPPAPPSRHASGGDLTVLAPAADVDGNCFALTPPPGADEGQRLVARWRREVARLDWQPPETTTAYWVHQRPLGDLNEARRAVRELREAGFDGAALATGSGWTNVVVFGAFQERSRALARRDAVRANGFEARVSEREREQRPGRLIIRAAEPPDPPDGHQWLARDCAG